jgi:hypothetical protein
MYIMLKKTQKTYSLLKAAEKAGIHRLTLIRWLEHGYIKLPEGQEITMPSGNVLRLFTDADIEKLKAYKDEHYWDMPQAKRGKK